MKVNGPINCLVNHFYNILFCVQKKKNIHRDLEQSEHESIIIFGVKYPFNVGKTNLRL